MLHFDLLDPDLAGRLELGIRCVVLLYILLWTRSRCHIEQAAFSQLRRKIV